MVTPYDLVIEWLSVFLALGVVGVCLLRGLFFRYLFVNLYLLANAAFSVGCYLVRSQYGYDSYQYYYFYYTGDAIANIVAYVLIGTFFDRLLRESVFHKYVRSSLFLAFLLIVGISGLFLYGSLRDFYSEFIFEFQQNIYFMGVLLTFLLWMSISYLRVENRRFVVLVSGLGVYFAAHAASYAVQFLFPPLDPFAVKAIPLAYNAMLALWMYAFVYIPETDSVVVNPRRLKAWEDKALTAARIQ